MKILRVVVIDDTSSDREHLKRLVIRAGCEVVGEASGGDWGLELAKKLQPDLILTDYVMAHGSGVDVLNGTNRSVIIVSRDFDEIDISSIERLYPHARAFNKSRTTEILMAIEEVIKQSE